ncbi:MAG: PorV/PorQ family protein [bacterium]
MRHNTRKGVDEMHKNMTLTVCAIVLACILCMTAQLVYADTSGAAFLKIGVGARSIGMGSAFVGLSDDATASFWNPAGLTQLKKNEIHAMHTEWISDMTYDYIGYAIPQRDNTFGVSIIYLSTGNIEKRGASGEEMGDFSAYDSCATVSYARKLSSDIGLGVNVKVIQQKIDNETAKGVAVDIGQMYSISSTGLSLGLAVRNIGPKMKFIEEEYSLPLTVSLGAAYKILGIANIGMDIQYQVIDEKTNVSFGTEYAPVGMLSLRAGYLMKLLSPGSETGSIAGMNSDLGALSGLGAGFGMKLGGTSLDYAFVPYGDLGNTHRLSISSQF